LLTTNRVPFRENRSVDAWLRSVRDAVARASGIPTAELELGADDERLLLRAARIAAHDSDERTNAPLLCYLLGLAAGKSGATVDTIAAAVRPKADRP
jgi:hypothetical protein